MNHVILDNHGYSCCPDKKIFLTNTSIRKYCEMSQSNILFYLYGKFHIVTYNRCYWWQSPHDFCKLIIEKACKDSKITTKSINKSEEFNSRFKEAAIIGLKSKHTITEINYIYENAAGKEWAVVTRLPFCEALINEESFYAAYLDAQEYIKENIGNSDFYIEMMGEIYHRNVAYRKNKTVTVANTIDLLIKQINKK